MTAMTAQAAAIAHLTAEVERLTRENEVLRAMQAVVDAVAARRDQATPTAPEGHHDSAI